MVLVGCASEDLRFQRLTVGLSTEWTMRIFAILWCVLFLMSCGSNEPSGGSDSNDNVNDDVDGSVIEPDTAVSDTDDGESEHDLEETVEGPCVSLTLEQVGELEVHPPSRVSLSFRVSCDDELVTDLSFPGNFDFRDDAEFISDADAVFVSVEDADGGFYRIDYCSPRRSGPHDLQLRANWNGISGFLSDRYTASNFTDGCIADRDVCPVGMADCDGTNGDCETNVLLSNDDCGGCGASFACGSDEACVDGVCVITCNGDETACGNRCADLMTSTDHCGDCGNLCTWEGEICDSGTCVCPDSAKEIAECDSVCIECDAGDTAHCAEHGPNQCCPPETPRFCDVAGWGADCFGVTCADCDCSTVVRCPNDRSYLCPLGEQFNCEAERCE